MKDLRTHIVRSIQSEHFYIAILVGMSAVLYTFLRSAYPMSFVYPDSGGYLQSADAFLSWEANVNDWLRTPYTGMIFLADQYLPGTTHFSFLVAAGLSVFALILCFRLFAEITKSPLCGFALAFLYLLWEWTNMRGPMYTLQLLSDGYFSSLLFIAILATLLSLRRGQMQYLLLAACSFGLSVAFRPNGFLFLLLWSPLIFVAYCRTQTRSHWTHTFLGPLVAFIIFLPGGLWSFHNYIFYDTFKHSTIGAHNALAFAIRFLRSEDVVFQDLATNERFHRIVKAIRQEHGDSLDSYLWAKPKKEEKLFDYLMTTTPSATSPSFIQNQQSYSRMRFELGPIAFKASLAIIRKHPRDFLHTWLVGYVLLFNAASHYMQFAPIDILAPHSELYQWVYQTPTSARRIFSSKEPRYSDLRYVLRTVPTVLSPFRMFLARHVAIGFLFWHTVLLLSIFFSWKYRKTPHAFIPITLVFLILTAVLNHATIAAVHDPSERYALSAGAPLVLAFIFILYRFLYYLKHFADRFRLLQFLVVHLRRFLALDQ